MLLFEREGFKRNSVDGVRIEEMEFSLFIPPTDIGERASNEGDCSDLAAYGVTKVLFVFADKEETERNKIDANGAELLDAEEEEEMEQNIGCLLRVLSDVVLKSMNERIRHIGIVNGGIVEMWEKLVKGRKRRHGISGISLKNCCVSENG